MQTRYRVWLNGQPLDGVSDSLVITDIVEYAPECRVDTARRALGEGTLLLGRERTALRVAVRFYLPELEPSEARAVLGRILAWASSDSPRALTVSTLPDRRLWVRCRTVGSAQRWAQERTLVFEALELPFWQDCHPLTATLTGRAAEAVIHLGGTARGQAQVTVTSQGSTVQQLRLTVGGSVVEMQELALTAQETLTLGWQPANGFTMAVQGPDYVRSALSCRTAASDDTLRALPGANTLTLTADRAVRAVFRLWGCCL